MAPEAKLIPIPQRRLAKAYQINEGAKPQVQAAKISILIPTAIDDFLPNLSAINPVGNSLNAVESQKTESMIVT